ncbi:type 1 glutamine amidotransferase [Leadbetterella sp. DM7]|uniref:type 1 glutamine amidotransferase n=1 Tax=Leadbetterella sp. DM7 TaxID=3235085 RepID=UPI00349EA11F
MHIHFIQHEVFEAPGACLEWAKDRKHDITFSKVYENQPLPETADNIDILIVMGGPQDPGTTREECPHFDAHAEKALIQKAVEAGRAVVGICLGSQLIGEALGARFEHSPEKEIGVFPIRLTADGLKDEKLNHFGASLAVGHWHNDMPGLTPQSKVMATSAGCPRQIVAYSNLVYGFQCHMELTPEVVELLIAEELDFLENNTVHAYVQKPEEICKHNFSEMNEKLFQFLDKLAEEYRLTSSLFPDLEKTKK